MAKDVNLSSKEWTDIVFEGKNKEFGAYTMRKDSPKRHTTAVLVVLGVLVVGVVLLILFLTGAFKFNNAADAQGDMVAVDIGMDEEMEEEPEMIQEIETPPEPEPEPQQAEEDVTASQAVTEIKLVDVVDEEKKIKDIEEIKEDTRVISNKDYEGKEDLNKEKVIAEVVEQPKPVEAPPAPKVEEKPKEEPKPVVPEKPKDEGPVNMAMVEQKPMFPGGDAAMMKFLSSNISYPPQAAEEGVSGKVTVQFVVEKDGSISNVTVARGKHPALDKEAVRVVKMMPKWTPGRNNGQPVRVTYMLPVTFKLQ